MQMDKYEKRIAEYFKCIKNSAVRKEIQYVLNGKNVGQVFYLLAIIPALFAFVIDVIRDANVKGKTRLYFLSRDGFQMYLIAKKIVELENLEIECRYLHVSRFSMRVPGYHLDVDSAIDSICVGGINVTYSKILRRAGLKEHEQRKILNELGVLADKDKILNYRQILKFKEKAISSINLKDYIIKHSSNAYVDAMLYLQQEGLMEDDRYALVDSGWIGTLQCSIEKLVQVSNPEIKVEGYYFGMYEYPKNVDVSRFHSYYFGPTQGLIRKSQFSNSLFEAIVSAKEGMTIRYERDDGRVIPVHNHEQNPNYESMDDNIKVLKELLSNIKSLEEWKKIDRKCIEKLFGLFMARPSTFELVAYGDMRFSDDVIDGNYQKTAAELTYEQIRDQWFTNKLLIVSGINKKPIYESAWIEGSAVRCGKNIKKNLKHIRRYKRFVYIRKQMSCLVTKKD